MLIKINDNTYLNHRLIEKIKIREPQSKDCLFRSECLFRLEVYINASKDESITAGIFGSKELAQKEMEKLVDRIKTADMI